MNLRTIAFINILILLCFFCSSCRKKEIITVKEAEWLRKNPGLIAGISPDAPPYQYINEKGEVGGIFIDYLTIIEKKINYKFKRVYESDFSVLLSQINENKIDVLLEMQETDERKTYLNFTPSLISHPHIIVVRKNENTISAIDDLTGKKIAVVNKFAIQEHLQKNYPQFEILPFFDNIECLRAVSAGQADAFVCQQAVATYYISQQGISNLKISGEINYKNNLAIASGKKSDTLNIILTKAVNSISEKEKKAIYNKWISLTETPFYLETKFLIAIFFISFFLVVIFIVFNRALRMRVRIKTHELYVALEKMEVSERNLKIRNNEYEAVNEELKQINEELFTAKEKAEESIRLKNAFLQNMTHEVRTPLNSIVGFSQLMTNPSIEPAKISLFSKIISENSEKLVEIITDITEMAQIQSNSLKPNFQKINCSSVVITVINKFQNKAKLNNVELKYSSCGANNDCIVFTDGEKLQRILFHLLDNAIKFTPKGIVQLLWKVENETIHFTVSDTGIGIPDEVQKIIFEPFRQVDIGMTRNYGGNGLGLSLVKAYTEILGGKVTLKSEVNKGSDFTISLPLVQKLSENISKQKVIYNNKIEAILIAEDEYSNFEYLKELLSNCNIPILHARNGKEAVIICSENSAVGLVLMDIGMPIMDGHTATKHIKELRPDLPVIAQTAYALENEKQYLAGIFDDYLTKPILIEALNKTIEKYLKKSSTEE